MLWGLNKRLFTQWKRLWSETSIGVNTALQTNVFGRIRLSLSSIFRLSTVENTHPLNPRRRAFGLHSGRG